ncbi:hypothetical protein ACMZ5F_29730 [Streptomyces rhizosphaericola]|uniref:hypothetical protein n=1 Tax=Streptomyces rhizosphaericola TaxID=2564098 RepID=UPI0039EFAC8A
MAKQCVTVCLPPCAPGEALDRAIAEAMAPFDMNRQDDLPGSGDGEWDYWYIASGWEFAVRPGYEDDPRIVRDGEEKNEPRLGDRCAGGPKALLNLDADRVAVAEEAARRWEAWQEFSAGYPAALPAHHFWARVRLDPQQRYSFEQARAEYESQPLIRAVYADPVLRERFGDDPVQFILPDRDAYVAEQYADVLPTWALLTLDGRWIEGGTQEYHAAFNAYLDRLPDATMLVRVLYHS